MNDFWDNLGKAVNDAAHKAIKASGDAVELTKTSWNIKLDEIKRESLFKEIGRIIYANYRQDSGSAGEEIVDFCKCIEEIELAIAEQKVKAADLKNKKFCINCKFCIEKGANYCYSCGARQPIIVEKKEDECCCDDDCGCDDDAQDCGCDDDCGCDSGSSDCGCDDDCCN